MKSRFDFEEKKHPRKRSKVSLLWKAETQPESNGYVSIETKELELAVSFLRNSYECFPVHFEKSPNKKYSGLRL